MLEKRQGVTAADIGRACELLVAASTLAEMDALVADEPLYRHAVVQDRIRTALSAGSEREQIVCRLFFLALHRAAHLALAQAPVRGAVRDRIDLTPPRYRHLLSLIGDRVPPTRASGPRAPDDWEGLRQDLGAVGIGLPEAVLSEGKDESGEGWSIVVVACARCDQRRVIARAHYIDLRVDRSRASLLEHNETVSVCPACGSDVQDALDVWVQEEPRTYDALAALATEIRLTDWLNIYQPPAWGLDVETSGTMLEARAQDGTGRTPAPGEISFTSVEYSREALDAKLQVSDADSFRLACAAIEFQLERGVKSFAEIDALVRRVAQQGSWPLARLASPLPRGRRFGAVAIALLAEAVGEARAEDSQTRALLAVDVVAACTAAGLHAPARAAVGRAKRALEAVGADAVGRPGLATLVGGAEGDVLAALGHREAAAQQRLDAMMLDANPKGSPAQRLQCWRATAMSALVHKQSGQWGEAVPEFVLAIGELMKLRDGDALDLELRELTALTLSGALANFAGALLDIADEAALGKEVDPRVLELAVSFDELGAADDAPSRLLRAAGRLLGTALNLSIEHQFWRFAGRQAFRSAEAARRAGTSVPAEVRRSYLALALEYAERAGDRETLMGAAMSAAGDDARAGTLSAALANVERAAEAVGRGLIDGGGGEPQHDGAVACAISALRLAAHGADATRAVLVAEGMKSVGLARTMEAGRLGRVLDREAPGIAARRHMQAKKRFQRAVEQIAVADVEHRAPWEHDAREARLEVQRARQDLITLDPAFLRWSDARAVELPTPADLERVLGELGSRSTLLGAAVDGESLFVYAAWSGRGLVCVHESWRTWRADVATVVQSLAEGEGPSADLMARVSRRLLTPIVERLTLLNASDRLVVSFLPELGQLPVGALVLDGRRLIERVTISYVPAFGVLSSAVARAEGTALRGLVLGAPIRQPPAPPKALAELRAVAQLWRDAGLAVDERVGQRARPRDLAELAPSADLIHIACHGQWSESDTSPARLDLAPDLEDDDDGNLTPARIVEELDVRPGSTVVLAACESGLSGHSSDDGRNGLVPALLAAGASTVVATLWRINDRDTLVFVQAFYRHLASGVPASDALARTQRDALSGQLGDQLARPQAWSAFVVNGR